MQKSDKKYIKLSFYYRDKRFNEYKKVTSKNLKTAFKNMEGRLEKLNELRGDVATKGEITAVEKRLSDMEKFQSKLLGIGIVVMIVAGLLGAAIMRLFTK
jgi:hypothetical protein